MIPMPEKLPPFQGIARFVRALEDGKTDWQHAFTDLRHIFDLEEIDSIPSVGYEYHPDLTPDENKRIEREYDYAAFGKIIEFKIQTFKDGKSRIEDPKEEFWTLATYFFLCYAYDTAQGENILKEQRDWLGARLCSLSNDIEEKNREFCHKYCDDFGAQAAGANTNLQAYSSGKEFVSDLFHRLFGIEEKRGVEIPEGASEKDADVVWLLAHCAYHIGNANEWRSAIDYYVTARFINHLGRQESHTLAERGYFTEFSPNLTRKLLEQESIRSMLETSGTSVQFFPADTRSWIHSTILTDKSQFCRWLNLLFFFKQISEDEKNLILKSLGDESASLCPSSSESREFTVLFKKTIGKSTSFLKNRLGLTICHYLAISHLNLHDFREVFLEKEESSSCDNGDFGAFCSKSGIRIVKERHFRDGSLQALQLLLDCALFDLSLRFDGHANEAVISKKETADKIKAALYDGEWHKKEFILDFFKELARKIDLNGDSPDFLFEDLESDDEITESTLRLVFHISKFLCEGFHWLFEEINHIQALQANVLNIPSHKEMPDNDHGKAVVRENWQTLCGIDSGFRIHGYTQHVEQIGDHMFGNLFISRDICVKLFPITYSDPTKKQEDDYYKKWYSSLLSNKYAYHERNMAVHFADFRPTEIIWQNLQDLLVFLESLPSELSSLQWKCLKNGCLENIKERFPYCEEVLIDCFRRIHNLTETGLGGPIFKDGHLNINRNKLKRFGEDHQEELRPIFTRLKPILDIVFCNSEIAKYEKIEYECEGGKRCDDVLWYSTSFLEAYQSEVAVYLINIALKLTRQLQEKHGQRTPISANSVN